MKHFRKIWDEEKTAFVKSTKGMTRQAALKAFREKYPELIGDVTDMGFYDKRSRVGAAGTRELFSTKKRPLYSERVKRGRSQIKIAQPNVWVSKAKWVYMNTHPNEDLSARSNYIFLDGDRHNFEPDNIARVPIELMGIFNQIGGVIKGAPELTRINIARAKLKRAQLDALEKHGQVVRVGSSRKDRLEHNESVKEYTRRNKERIAERRKELYRLHHEERLQKQREYRAQKKAEKK